MSTSGSVPYKLMKDIILSPFLIKDIAKLSPAHQTYSLGVFHSVVNHYAPKSTHFYYPAMYARYWPKYISIAWKFYTVEIQCISYHIFFPLRLSVAALHFNESSGRQQATSKSGELQYGISYPKAKKGLEAVVKPKKTPPTFSM